MHVFSDWESRTREGDTIAPCATLHRLLLNEGKQLSRALIDKLIAFEESEGARYTLFIHPAPQASLTPQAAV